MGHSLSMDLRVRLLAAIDNGVSCRTAAARFGVAPSTAIRRHARRRDAGTFAAKPLGGDLRSGRIEERAGDSSVSGMRARTFRPKNCGRRWPKSAGSSR
jgi:transposase